MDIYCDTCNHFTMKETSKTLTQYGKCKCLDLILIAPQVNCVHHTDVEPND